MDPILDSNSGLNQYYIFTNRSGVTPKKRPLLSFGGNLLNLSPILANVTMSILQEPYGCPTTLPLSVAAHP